MANTKEYLIKTVYDSTGLKRFAEDTEKAKAAAAQLGLSLSSSAKVVDQNVTTSFNKAGQAVRNVSTVFEQNGTKSRVAFQEVAGSVNPAASSLKNFSESAQKVDINLGKLISRALVTIPVWLALRAAVMGFIFGIREGFKDITAFDAAMQKLRGNLSGTPAEITATMLELKQEFTDLSVKTGVSVEDIANAFQKFATVCFGVKESLTGAIGATKLAIAFFANSTETANAFARGLRVLVDQSHGVASSQKQMEEAMALTAELWQKNAFEVNEMNQGLEKFAAVAQTSKISMKETLVLLATMGTAAVGGARGGTLLRTSFQNMVQHVGELAKQLGIQVNPQLDTTFMVLTKVIDALAKMDANSTLVIERTGAMAKIFGGVRGSLPIQALVAMNDLLKENMKYTGDTAFLNQRVKEVLESESGQAKILGNQMATLGRSFVTSVVGGENFAESLKKINDWVTELIPKIEILGNTIHNMSNFGMDKNDISNEELHQRQLDELLKKRQKVISQAMRGELPASELEPLKLEFKNMDTFGTAEGYQFWENVKKAIANASSKEDVASKLEAKAKLEINPTLSSQPVAIRSLENELAELKARLKAKGATDLQLQLLDVQFEQSKSVIDANKVRDEQSKIRVKTSEKELSIQELLLKSVEDMAKAEGASNLEAISRRIELEKQLGIEKTGMDLLAEQLELQKALTEETKKTRQERLKDLEKVINKVPSAFKNVFANNSLDFQEERLKNRAAFRGISDEQVNKILHPEDAVKSGLLRDLQTGLAQPMTKSMGSLENAISSLTQTIIQQETRPTGVSVPQWPTPTVNKSDVTVPGTQANRDIQQVMEDF